MGIFNRCRDFQNFHFCLASVAPSHPCPERPADDISYSTRLMRTIENRTHLEQGPENHKIPWRIPLKVTVFGATGKTGDLTWRKARESGHEVTVFGRSVEARFSNEDINRVAGDVLDYSSVSSALAGREAALVCLGPTGTKDHETLSQGAENIRRAMLEHGLKRVIFVSAAGVGESWSKIPWYSKILFSTMLKTILAEHAREEEIFCQDDLDWTAVRAAVLKNGTSNRGVIAANDIQTKTIFREDLAEFLVGELAKREYVKQSICVTSA